MPATTHVRRAPGLPDTLARVDNRVVRPRDFTGLYRHPGVDFARMAKTGVLAHVAHGYYAVVPEHNRGRVWRPAIDAIALGIAVADYGVTDAALMGITAARVQGAIPRALRTAVVAVPKQRPTIDTQFGRVVFVKRAIATLDLQRVQTTIVEGYVTTPEQTVLDLAARPTLGGITETTTQEAIELLITRCRIDVLWDVARRQRKLRALEQLQRQLPTNREGAA